MSVTLSRTTKIATLLVTGTLAITLGACSSSTKSSSNAGASSAASSSAPATSAAATDQPFGAACAAVPNSGAGSFSGMAQDPVATAASNNPLLSTLVTAVKAAGLVDTLNSAKDITVFAPTNDAFAKIPKAQLDALLADKAMLTKVLTYHVETGKIAPTALAGSHKSLEGSDVMVAGSGQDFTANGNSKVLCGNVQTANATVYIIDSVLMPKAAS